MLSAIYWCLNRRNKLLVAIAVIYLTAPAAGANTFEPKSIQKAFACPEAAFRSGPTHKKGKHGLCPEPRPSGTPKGESG